jgi:hypothetical protein
MTQVWIGEGTSGTCAGAPIKSSMHPYSDDLFKGCKKFSELAVSASSADEVRLYNSSCIFFSVSCIEARVNEWISIANEIEEDEDKKKFWSEMAGLQKTLKLESKWNLIASTHSGEAWVSGHEPFQSFEVIVSLRNELVHYKGHFLGKDEAPNRKIKALMNTLGVKSKATFIEDSCSSWSYDLLSEKDLGAWVYQKTKPFYENVLSLLTKP